ncbi:uncharacterized protein LOC129748431 [Uranotaenia lowii]|uniref:uncharacterized protein LOC129748431 n=1 Tax=Uranotaenia lowii TaxID=190385 RepID=UPI00247889E7|nr:uncharacterized protein LOC129748431 [Uranotaenia lowii]
MYWASAIFASLFLISFSLAEYSDQQRMAMDKITNMCLEELGLESDSLIPQKAQYGGLKERDEISSKYIHCAMMRFGFMGPDGKFNLMAIEDFLVPHYAKESVRKTLEACNDQTGDTPEHKAFNFNQCFFEKKEFEI